MSGDKDDDAPFEPMEYEALLALREGRRTTVYKDSLGKPTGGIGHLITPADNMKVGDHISDAQISAWFQHDSISAMNAAKAQAAQAGITEPTFLPYLASVCYQLGNNWTAKWPHTWAMICAGEYEKAADSLEGTPWDKQTPQRVEDFSDALYNLPPKGTV